MIPRNHNNKQQSYNFKLQLYARSSFARKKRKSVSARYANYDKMLGKSPGWLAKVEISGINEQKIQVDQQRFNESLKFGDKSNENLEV